MQILVCLSRVALLCTVTVSMPLVAWRALPPRELPPIEFANVGDDRRQQVMFIGPGEMPGSLFVLTRRKLEEFDRDGKRIRALAFPEEYWLPFATRFTDRGALQIVGLRSRIPLFRSYIDLLTTDGKTSARIRAWEDGIPEAADVVGDGAKEIVVRHTDGVAVWTADGRRLGFVRSPRYLYHFRTIAIPAESKRAIAMWMWRDNKRGTDISVRRADGSEIASWNQNAGSANSSGSRLAVFALDGDREGLWSALDGQIVERSATGAIRRTFDVPGLRNFRYLHGGNLANGWKVIVASMGKYGDLIGRVAFVFDPAGTLVARDYSTYPSWAFYIPDPAGTTFFLGASDRVLKYDIAQLVR